MTDFPHSVLEFQQRSPDEDACAAYLAALRCPAGFVCPACGGTRGGALATKAHTHECADCRKQTSVTAGTVMHGYKLAPTAWFWAAYLMATHSNGISALQLQKQLGLGTYKAAWLLATKLRRTMVTAQRMLLAGPGRGGRKLDLLPLQGRPAERWRRRSRQGKLLVAGAVEVGEGGPGRMVRTALLHRFAKISRPHVQRLATSTRMYLRFVTLSGGCSPGHVGAIPAAPRGESQRYPTTFGTTISKSRAV